MAGGLRRLTSLRAVQKEAAALIDAAAASSSGLWRDASGGRHLLRQQHAPRRFSSEGDDGKSSFVTRMWNE